MIVILGDLLADIALHIDRFPIQAEDLKQANYIEIGPGGAANVAITAARFGLDVSCLGEVGDDTYADVVREGLSSEKIDVSGMISTAGAKTPVACVIVDRDGEPAYIGFRGTLQVRALAESWRSTIQEADALFVDGWADHAGVEGIVMEGLRVAKAAGVVTFFDPGPGNQEFNLDWHVEAASIATILMLNEEQAIRLTGAATYEAAAIELLNNGSRMVFVKLGGEGSYILRKGEEVKHPGMNVDVLDKTGAGDAFDAAVIYGYLSEFDPKRIGVLANAVGAAKASKRGTGFNMPTVEEIRSQLQEAGEDPNQFLITN